jgi:hypothetical protein
MIGVRFFFVFSEERFMYVHNSGGERVGLFFKCFMGKVRLMNRDAIKIRCPPHAAVTDGSAKFW